jgi:23S rRNA (cytosine1962-C5)-methyltransferase
VNNHIDIWQGNLPGYTLLDSGNKLKLEEVAGVRLVRSEPRAWWSPALPKSEWDKAEARFETEKGSWKFAKGEPKDATLVFENITFKLKFPTNSKHVGLFPEQVSQWSWIAKQLDQRPGAKVLNLFGYTGGASLVAAAHGAHVTHVDGSRAVIGWARENQEASQLADKPIRWILDDAVDFVKREIKRGNKYDAIIMDPPSFGRGPQGQVWKVEEDLVPFLKLCREAMTENPLFFVLNMYSTELSAISLKNLLQDLFQPSPNLGEGKGEVVSGELALAQEDGRLLPLSIFANWSAK